MLSRLLRKREAAPCRTTFRPQGFSSNDLARAWVSQHHDRGDTFGQVWSDDLSGFLILHGKGVGRFRLPRSSVDEPSSASVLNGVLLLDTIPPCSIPTLATFIESQTKSHAGAGLLLPRPFDVQVSVAVEEAAIHDVQCLYAIRQLPTITISASITPARLELRQPIKVRPEEKGNPSYRQTFSFIRGLHPATNDGDAIVLEHYFSRASNGAEQCKCAWCVYSSSLQPPSQQTVRTGPPLQWDKLWTFLAPCVRVQFFFADTRDGRDVSA